jgi:hypothetical protein
VRPRITLAAIAACLILPALIVPASASASCASIADRLTASRTSVKVTCTPAGTEQIHIAVMQDLAGHGIKYLNVARTQTVYTPPAGLPVVDVQAWASGPVGEWAGRKQTIPGGPEEDPKEEENKERPKEEEKKERPKEEEKKNEEEKEEAPKEEEPPREEEHSGAMVVGVDTGGWGGSLLQEIVGGGIPYLRVQQGAAAGAYSVEPGHIGSIIFGEGGSIEGIDAAAYGAEVASAAARYAPLAVEVLNEPGGSWFWSDADTPGSFTAYAKLAKVTHEDLAGVTPRPAELCSWDGGQDGDNTFGRGIKADGALAYCDGVTVHPYGGSSGQDGGAAGNRHEVEVAHSESGLPVYVTEVGWPTDTGGPSTGDSQQWSEAQQAENITNFVDWARGTGYVRMVMIFNGVDYGSNDFYGIEKSNRQHKLSFAALAAVAK